MTSPAAFNLVGAGFRPSVSGRPLTLTDQPGSHGGKLDPWGQSLAPASRFCMLLSVFMAGRAPNRYLSPAGIIAIGFRVIVANQSRGMAIRTLVVPVLVNASPVHGVARMVCTWLIQPRSEEHTSELQSRPHLVCRLLLEKKKKKKKKKLQ